MREAVREGQICNFQLRTTKFANISHGTLTYTVDGFWERSDREGSVSEGGEESAVFNFEPPNLVYYLLILLLIDRSRFLEWVGVREIKKR